MSTNVPDPSPVTGLDRYRPVASLVAVVRVKLDKRGDTHGGALACPVEGSKELHALLPRNSISPLSGKKKKDTTGFVHHHLSYVPLHLRSGRNEQRHLASPFAYNAAEP
jgi:hypothetical protein